MQTILLNISDQVGSVRHKPLQLFANLHLQTSLHSCSFYCLLNSGSPPPSIKPHKWHHGHIKHYLEDFFFFRAEMGRREPGRESSRVLRAFACKSAVLQMPAMAGARSGPKPGTESRSPTWVSRTQLQEPLLLPPGIYMNVSWDQEPEWQWNSGIPTWDEGILTARLHIFSIYWEELITNLALH